MKTIHTTYMSFALSALKELTTVICLLFIFGVGNVWGDETFELVTDVSDLSADDEIIILSSNGSYALSTEQRTANRGAVAPAANNWSISGTTVTLYASTTVQVITLEVYHDDEDDEDYWEFNVGGTNKYLYASSSSSNELKSRSSNASDYNGDWTIELDASYVATIQSIGTNSRRRMRCNTGNNPPIFACYGTTSSTGTLVKIYKKGTAASCNANPSTGNASINGSFTLTSLTDAVSVSSGTWGTGSSDCAWIDYGFVWGTTSSPTTSNNKVQVGTSGKATSWTTGTGHEVQPSGSTNPTAWVVGTTYYVKAYGKNGKDGAAFAYSGTAASFTLRSIDFEENGGSTVNMIYANSGGTATKPSDPTKTGYTFGGWYKEVGLSNAVTWASDAISENKTYYAKWSAKTYAITLNGNGGTGSSPASVNATYNAHALSAAITNPEKTDYIFEGWNTKADGSGLTVIGTNGELISSVSGYTDASGNWTKDGTETLYAKWTPHTFVNYRTSCSTDQCKRPTFSPAEGTYNSNQSVTISCGTDGATIYYTTNGDDPNTSSSVYSSAISVTQTTTIKAYAVKGGLTDSEVATATYTMQCATPTFDVAGGAYLGSQTVAISSTTPGVTIYYTTNGSTPTTGSTVYSSPLTVSSSQTIQAIAVKSNWTNSTVGSATYTITPAHTVTWMNRGTELTSELVANGSAPAAFPSDAKTGCDEFTNFYGWANKEWNGEKSSIAAPPAGLACYTAVGDMPTSSVDVTYYAVWTDEDPEDYSSDYTAGNGSNGGAAPVGCNTGCTVSVGEITNIPAVKIGRTNGASSYDIYLPSGTTKLSFRARYWDEDATVTLTYFSDGPTINSGTSATCSPTLTGSNMTGNNTSFGLEEGDDLFEYTIGNVNSNDIFITLNAASYNRVVIYDINTSTSGGGGGGGGGGGSGKYITNCCEDLDDLNETHSETYNSVTLTWDDIDNVTAWTVTGVDGSSVAVPAGDIGTPTDGGSTYSCVISNLSQYTDYTFTITATPASGYCDKAVDVAVKTPCVAPSSLSISSTGSKWDFCAGESMTLTVNGTNISGSATYQWQKHNGSTWVDIDGANSASYTVASMAASNAGQYRCTVTNPGSSCDATTTGVWVRLWQLYINNGTADAWQSLDFSNTGTGTGSNTSVYLTSDKGYQFKLIDNNNGYFGLNDKTVTTTIAAFALNGTGANVNVTSGLEGNYTFAINYSDKNNPTVAITYPVGNQASGKKIWFDKSVITGWTDAGTSDLVWRIGKSNNSMTNEDATANAFALVPGTDRFYVYETKEYNGFEAWHIANNTSWSGTTDGTGERGIYYHYHNQAATDVTRATVYQKYVVGNDGVTLVPTTKKNTDYYCDFWYVDKYDGMLTHNASITAYSHGTVTVSYTNTSSVASSFTSGNEDLAHRCILTITAVPDPGYNLTSLQVNSANFTSGNEHVLSADATITAVFSPKTTTITFDKNSGTGGDNGVTATYDADMPTVSVPSRANYNFGGYFDAETDDNGSGTKYYNANGTSAKVWDKTDATLTLYAQWTGDTYNITYKDKGDVAYSGNNSGSLVATHTYGAATVLVAGTKTGYHFDGWYTTSACTGDPITSVGASAFTADFTLYAKWTIENYSVTWKVNGSNYTTGSPTDNADYNTKVSTLPTAPSAPEGCSDKVFKGWSTSNLGDASGQSAPGDLFTDVAGSPAITTNTIFHAVFADETPASSTTAWQKRTYTQLSEAGTYIIVDATGDKAFNGTLSSGKGNITAEAFSFTDDIATSAPDGAQELTFTMPTAYQFTITKTIEVEGVPTTYYLYATKSSSGGLAWTTNSSDLGGNYWTNKNTSGTVTTMFRYSETFTPGGVNKWAHMRGNSLINTYQDASYQAVYFAKKTTVDVPASYSNYVTICDEPAECGTPTFDPGTDTYNDVQTVTISTVTDGATIRYTTDGTNPTSSSGTVYSTPVEVSCTTTLKAIAYKAGRTDSEIGSATITIKVPNPTFNLTSGTYKSAQTITLSDAMDGADIYYTMTTNGDDPTTPTMSDTKYTGSISISTNSTVKISAKAFKDGCADPSDVVTRTYVIRIGTVYTLVTSADDLNAGDKIVIVGNLSDKTALSTDGIGGNNRPYSDDYDINGDKTEVTVYPLVLGASKTVQVIDLQGEPGAWALYADNTDVSGKKYLGINSDNNYLKTYVGNTDNTTKWSISIASNLATIVNNDQTGRSIQVNNAGTPYACYPTTGVSSQTKVKIYSVPNPDPVIKVEASLSAFAGCTSEASAAQSFYVSGKNLSADIRVTAPTGYEVSLSSGSGYADYIDVARVGTTVSKTQVYVRIKTGQSVGSPSGNIVVSVSADDLSKNVAVSGTVSAADTYIDRMHGNSTTYQCGSYDAPDLADFDGSATDCEENYAIFQGWVAASEINLDGTLKAGATVISDGTAMTADGTTYYSVWEALAE